MDKSNLLFYDAYENFYLMVGKSKAFKAFCKDAFGEDLSQDGFSDIDQVNMILPFIAGPSSRVLDVGCGNGKMLKYLKEKSGCCICGFDYSVNAIENAKRDAGADSDFRVGIIGEVTYPEEYFDLITSMDTVYFAQDMTSFVAQMMRWLKNGGVLFVAYQEGDVMPKTQNEHTTVLAEAFRSNGIEYEAADITKQTYELLLKKRNAAISHRDEFAEEGNDEWLDMLMLQTECVTRGYDQYASEMSRYIYTVHKA